MVSHVESLRHLAQLAREERDHERRQLALLELVFSILPVPTWIKRLEVVDGRPEFRMVRVNRAYQLRWQVAPEHYVDRLDRDVWPREIAEEFRANDIEAVNRSPVPFYTYEPVPERVQLTPEGTLVPVESDTEEKQIWRIAKAAEELGGETYVAGTAWDLDRGELAKIAQLLTEPGP